MMGTKKLSEIKAELRQALGRQNGDLNTWLDRQVAKLRTSGERDLKVIEDLLWVQKALRQALKQKKSRGRKPKKAKKQPAA